MRIPWNWRELAREPLLEDLYDNRRIALLRFANEQMEVFWHDHVAHNDETIICGELVQVSREKDRDGEGFPKAVAVDSSSK